MSGVRRFAKTSGQRALQIDVNCRALAARITDEQGRRKLEAMAVDYESQADALEALAVAKSLAT